MKYPKMKRTLAALTILGAGLIAVACGGDDPVDDTDGITGDGDGDNVDAELKALQDQIDALEKLLEDTTNADAIASLEKQIKALKDALDKLTAPGCGMGGDCVGLPAATRALEPVIAAVCEHLEGCCTPSVMKFSLGLGIDDAESCTEVLTNRYTTDLNLVPSNTYLTLPIGFELPYLPAVAASLEQGRIELNEDAIEACIDALGDLDCEAFEGPSCGENIETLCYGNNFFTGILTEGALCSPESVNECEEGYFCYGPASASVCQENSGIGGPCLNGNGCSEGYCDARTDICVEYAQEGDDCSYQDPHGNKYPNLLVEHCDSDLDCSLTTGKCVSTCGNTVGMNCSEDYDCADGAYCDTDVEVTPGYAQYSYIYGSCADKVGTGVACTASNQCDSGMCDIEGTDVCLAPVTTDTCSNDSDCEGDEFCYGYTGECLTDKFADGTYCDADNWCAGGLCTNGACDSVGITGASCNSGSSRAAILDGSRACPSTDYCSYQTYTCTPKLALGADCSGIGYGFEIDVACGSANYCDPEGECAAQLNNGAECDASTALSYSGDEQGFRDACKSGSYCKVTDSRTDYTGKCATQVGYAGLCDASQPSNLQQCKGNTSCVDRNGVLVCQPDYGPEDNFCPISFSGGSNL